LPSSLILYSMMVVTPLASVVSDRGGNSAGGPSRAGGRDARTSEGEARDEGGGRVASGDWRLDELS